MNESPPPAVSLTVASNPFGDRFLAEINRETFARQDAASVFARQFADSFAREQTLYIIIGTDSGLLVDHILQSPLARGSRYLFVEAAPIRTALAETLTPLQNERVRVCSPDGWFSTAQDLGLDTYCYTGNIQLLRSLGADSGGYSDYGRIYKQIDQDLAQHRWKLEIDTGLHLFIKNNLANLADNRIPASVLSNSFKGKTALIMAAGPSLDGILPWIKQNRDRLVLIAVSRIARLLLDNNIPPDIIVSVDPQDISFAISKEIFSLGPDTLLAHSSSAAPAIVGQWCHDKVYTGPHYFWSMYDSPNIPQQGPTVTNEAISLALYMGFQQVLLAGVDLCFSATGHSHANGSAEQDCGPLPTRADLTVSTNSGRVAETNNGYYECIRQIELQIEESPAVTNCRIINLAAEAAAIKGVEYVAPNAVALDTALEERAADTLKRQLQIQPRDLSGHYQQTLKTLTRTIEEGGKIKKLAHEAIKCNRAITALSDDGVKIKNVNKLDKIEKQLERHHKALGDTIKLINAKHFARVLASDEGGGMSHEEANEKTEIYYQAYLHGARLLLEYLDDARTRVLARLEEEAPQPDIEKILDQWNRDGQPGRSIKWRNDHPQVYEHLPAADQARLAQLREMFSSGIKALDKQLSKHFSTANVPSYNTLLDTALAYHDGGDSQGIERLIKWLNAQPADNVEQNYTAVAKQPERLAASPVARKFIQGYREGDQLYSDSVKRVLEGLLHELADEPDQALASYGQVELKPYALHPGRTALERTLFIAIEREQYDTALSALERLASHLDDYKLYYARMLKDGRNIEGAINTYTDYISAHPTDLDALLELGALFADIGARDGVAAVRDNIAAQAKDHPDLPLLDQTLERMASQGVSD